MASGQAAKFTFFKLDGLANSPAFDFHPELRHAVQCQAEGSSIASPRK